MDTQGWDGTFNGQFQTSDVFVFNINIGYQKVSIKNCK